jgi:hypothetical protein
VQVPDRVPVTVPPLVRDLPVGAPANRSDHEPHAVTPVVEGVEEEGHAIVLKEIRVVLLHDIGDTALGLRLETPEGHVEVVFVEHHPDFGSFGGRRSLARLRLNEIRHRTFLLVNGFVEAAIHP